MYAPVYLCELFVCYDSFLMPCALRRVAHYMRDESAINKMLSRKMLENIDAVFFFFFL